ncbi:CpsD/CapB family tyrosine-protein kinase [Neobacillus drentensis]|uniref:CpsD/CapB family tyrosine-protein kinase n=1 Tax=Neobacillus drentensis TaxID=220684 RepID=UPI003001DAF4
MSKKRAEIKKINPMLQLNEDLISTEQIRMIRTNIDLLSDSKSTLLMVTSPKHEGDKSIISSKLAISLVEQEKKVLLVDANIRQPSLHNWFQITNGSGLTNTISNEEDIRLHYKETFVTGLFVLPTGPIPLNLSDIWVTSKIKEMVRKCESEFDVVIFVSPPFLTVSDSQILANQCDGVILVVKSNKTKKEDALKTRDYLARTNNRIVGVIYQT